MSYSANSEPLQALKSRKQFKVSSLSQKLSLLLIILSLLFLNSFPHAPLQLPPRLTPLLSHTTATYPPKEINDWKRPLTITAYVAARKLQDNYIFTAYATLNETKIRITLFTTGVDTLSYGRVYTAVGCKIGPVIVPNIPELDRPCMTTCDVDRSVLFENVPLTVLLNYTDELKTAMKEPQKGAYLMFEMQPGDVTVLPKRQRESFPQDLAEIKTIVNWKSTFLDFPNGEKYEFCAMTAMRQYPFLLKDWMSYYRRMGVDYFYIYENNAKVPLRNHVDTRFAEVVHWPWSRSQMQSSNHFLMAAKNRCKFVAFFDGDEFAMVGNGNEGALKRYVKHKTKKGYKQIAFHFLNMVNNGYVRRPQGSLPDLYTRREKDQKIKIGKVVVNMDTPWFRHVIHMVHGERHRKYWNTTLELNPLSLDHNAMLVHYTKRSWEDYCAKYATGGASVMTLIRPKKILDVNNPDPKYMNEEYEEFFNFRKRWNQIIKRKDHGRIVLIGEDQDKLECVKHYCPGCLFNKITSEVCEI